MRVDKRCWWRQFDCTSTCCSRWRWKNADQWHLRSHNESWEALFIDWCGLKMRNADICVLENDSWEALFTDAVWKWELTSGAGDDSLTALLLAAVVDVGRTQSSCICVLTMRVGKRYWLMRFKNENCKPGCLLRCECIISVVLIINTFFVPLKERSSCRLVTQKAVAEERRVVAFAL